MITDDQDYLNANEERIHGYLKSLIGNLSNIDLRNFVRFVTGSSVLLNNKITVSFNSLGGLARRPIAHTCSYILELSTTYQTYQEFAKEMKTCLRSEMVWEMDSL